MTGEFFSRIGPWEGHAKKALCRVSDTLSNEGEIETSVVYKHHMGTNGSAYIPSNRSASQVLKKGGWSIILTQTVVGKSSYLYTV